MYKQSDKAQSIKEIQKYLSAILPPEFYISENGLYDKKTMDGVKEFQKMMNLDDSGIVNYETRTLLYREYIKHKERDILSRSTTYLTFPVMPQDRNYGMRNLSHSITILMDYYGYTHNIRESEYYTPQLTQAVKVLRGIYLMEDAEYIDEALYMEIIRDIRSIAKKNNYK